MGGVKKTIAEHARRFSEAADDYDNNQTEQYEACAGLVIEQAEPNRTDRVLDIGTGTGAIALALAPDADEVIGRDIADGMLQQARRKADERDIDTVSFANGTFREPNVDRPVQIVTSNFAMHHLSDAEKREAIQTIAELDGGGTPAGTDAVGPRRVVLGDVMLFDTATGDEPFYDPTVDDPSTVGHLVDCFTDAGYAVTDLTRVHDAVGCLTAERVVTGGRE